MLEKLFTSKTRIQVLLKLFLNPKVSSYLRELAAEFKVSPACIKGELDGLAGAGYLERRQQGRSVYFRANTDHPFFPEIHSIVRKYIGIDRIVEHLMGALSPIESVYILDDYALGKDSGIIDLLIVGSPPRNLLDGTRDGVEKKINRKIRIMILLPDEFERDRDLYLNRPNFQIV